MTDHDDDKVRILALELSAICNGSGLPIKITMSALMTTLLMVIIEASDNEQQACALMQSASDQMSGKIERVPKLWPQLKRW